MKQEITDEGVEALSVEKATHMLSCSHGFCGSSRRDYEMPHIPLSKTKSGKIKILVFGKRWRDKDKIKKIRYVDDEKIRLIIRGRAK